MEVCPTLYGVKPKDTPPPLISKATRLSVRFWQNKAADYIRSKRGVTGQKQVGISRQTLSLIENGKANFTIETLVETLEAVGGDISEVFESPLPKDLRGQHRIWHEMLYEVMASQDEDDINLVEAAINASYQRLVSKRRGRAN